MKKLRLNKIFHWLYAFLMFYPILAFFGTIIVCAFNSTFSLAEFGSDFSSLTGAFWTVIDISVFSFGSGTVGREIYSIFAYVIYDFLGPENTDISSIVIELLTYWTSVSLVYLVFDVVMYPINNFHRWIDEGGI